MSEADSTEQQGAGRFQPLTILRLVLLIAPWAFIAYLYRDTSEVRDAFDEATPSLLAAALALVMVAVIGVGIAWVGLVRYLGGAKAEAVDQRALLRTYARSWMARYIPGVAWTYGARFVHTEEGIPRRVLAASMVDEFAMLAATTTAVGMGLWLWGAVNMWLGVGVLVVSLAAAVYFATQVNHMVHWALDHVGKVLPKRWKSLAEELGGDSTELPLAGSARFSAIFVVVALAAGAGFFFVLASLGDVSTSDLPQAAGGANLATILSIAIVFVPAGLGVREASLAAFAAPLVGDPVAATAALAFRVITVVADGAFFLIAEAIVAAGNRRRVRVR